MNLGRNQLLLIAAAIVVIVALAFLPSRKAEPGASETEEHSTSEQISKDLPEEFVAILEKAEKTQTEENYLQAADFLSDALMKSNDTTIYEVLLTEATRCYEAALKINPNNLDAKAGLGLSIASFSSDPMKGIMMLRDVVGAEPDNEKGQLYLGILSMKSGQYQKAVDRFEKVRVINSNNFNVLLRLAEAYVSIGNLEKANETLAQLENSEAGADLKARGRELKNELKGN